MNEPGESSSAVDLRSLVFHEDYRLSLVLEPDGRLRTVLDSRGVDGVDLFSLGGASIVETSRRALDGERRAAEWEQRLRNLHEHRRPIRYRTTPPGAAPGQPETVECVATPIPSADGSLECVLLEAADQSSQLRAEHRLRESEERFKQLAESLPQMVWVSEPSGEVVYFSPQWEAFTGRSQEALLGAGFRDLIHPDDLALIAPGDESEDEFKAVRFRMRNVAGEYRWMEADYRIVLDEDGQVLRWVGGTTDVTERRQAEDERREQQEQLRVALAVTGMGRYALYFREDRIAGDSRLSAILGVDVDEVMREEGLDGIFAVLHEDDVEHVRRAVDIAADHGPDYDVEYRMWRPTGDGDDELRWVAARGRVEFDAEGPVRMVGVLEDITQRKLEEEARLRWQKREEIGSLAGGIAHDFNNVISAILSNAALAETELRVGVSPAMSIAEIARGAERAADIVRRLLAFSREDEDEPVRGPFSLREVAEEACSLVGSSLRSEVTLQCKAAPGLPPVTGSSTELHQVVVNLVANANHAVEGRAGRIDVEVDEFVASPPSGQGPEGRVVRLRVRDTGTGIPDSVIGRIFDPFFTTRPAGKGTGLGLAAAMTIVRNHGGTITAENVDGGGALFTVLLPVGESAAEPASEPTGGLDGGRMPPGGPGGASVRPGSPVSHTPTLAVLGRVFFVDDEAALVRLAERALPIRGFAVRAFTDPHQALQELSAGPDDVDALVTDLSMPGISGLDLIARARQVRPDLPVILSSGFLTTANREQADRHGVDVIVPKPCSVDDLAGALAGLLDPGTGGRRA